MNLLKGEKLKKILNEGEAFTYHKKSTGKSRCGVFNL